MPQGHEDYQLHSNSSQHERTYNLLRQECQKGIKIVSFIPTPASMRGLTSCQGRNATIVSRLSASLQLQPASEDLLSIKTRMPQGHQDYQLHSNSSQHEMTYWLYRQECHKGMKTISFILQPVQEDLHPVKGRMPQGHEDCQLHSNSSQHERTYNLLRQECQKGIKIVSFISTPANMRGLTSCQGKNVTMVSRLSASFQL
jgi:hypothetical protein